MLAATHLIVSQIIDERRGESDYEITLRLPDGDDRTITILIPYAGGLARFVVDSETYGLNLVTRGHYR